MTAHTAQPTLIPHAEPSSAIVMLPSISTDLLSHSLFTWSKNCSSASLAAKTFLDAPLFTAFFVWFRPTTFFRADSSDISMFLSIRASEKGRGFSHKNYFIWLRRHINKTINDTSFIVPHNHILCQAKFNKGGIAKFMRDEKERTIYVCRKENET